MKIIRPLRHTLAKGFTLLELLIVVAILAVVGGLVIVAYDGLVSQTARGTAANALSSLDSSVRTYVTLERSLPDDLETLLSVEVSTGTTSFNLARADNQATAYNNSGLPTLVSTLNPRLAARLGVIQLTAAQKTNLLAAGIDTLRYMDRKGEAMGGALDIRAGDNTAARVGPILESDIPAQYFDAPLPGVVGNRGRGFSFLVRGATAAFLPHAAVWLPGVGGYENTRLGAPPAATLIVLGVGRNSSIVSTQGDSNNMSTAGRLATPPYYGDLGRAEYPNYLLVINVDTSPATFVATITPTGETQAESYAGGRGQ